MGNPRRVTPINADVRAPHLRKVAAVQTYGYKQSRLHAWRRGDSKFYWTTVYEDRAGRRRTSTTDNFNRIGNRTSVQSCTLSPLPTSILVSVGIVMTCLFIAFGALFGLVSIPFTLFASFWGYPLALEKIQRARFAKELMREDYDLPPLLSGEELDKELTARSQPDEDRSHEEPAPIPLPQLLRGRAWLHWEQRMQDIEKAGHRYLLKDAYHAATLAAKLKERAETLEFIYEKKPSHISDSMIKSMEESFRRTTKELKELAVPDVRLRRMTDEDGRPQLSRGFEPKTDCQNGHVGLHYASDFVIGTDRERRVPRACRWCNSQWTELAR